MVKNRVEKGKKEVKVDYIQKSIKEGLPSTPKKIIQIAFGNNAIFALRENGEIWAFDFSRWTKIREIPE